MTRVATGKTAATARKIKMGAYSTTRRSPDDTHRPLLWPRAHRRSYGSTSARGVSTPRGAPRDTPAEAPGSGPGGDAGHASAPPPGPLPRALVTPLAQRRARYAQLSADSVQCAATKKI